MVERVDFTKVKVSDTEYSSATAIVDSVLSQAVEQRATDIHLETEENVSLRFRINGFLYNFPPPPKEFYRAIVTRIKVLANLDITESRIPQSGAYKATVKGGEVNLRISTYPTIFGEAVAIRILDKRNVLLGFEQLGFQTETLARYNKILEEPYGIVLVTGPTGGGKSTTLYSSLNKIKSARIHIITIEDPVEYHISGLVQAQINLKAGFNFATGLRSILRQDPDVVMVGEIRDKETASISFQVAQTGQLVFATLHTNTAPGAATRLTDMGVEPFLVASSVIGVLSQTLVRTLCDSCKKEYLPSSEIIEELNLHPHLPPPPSRGRIEEGGGSFFCRGRGCDKCNGTGYKGRTGLFELMIPNDEIRELILKKAPTESIKEAARRVGMETLREDGMKKAREGKIALPDVLRVTKKDK